MLYSQRRNTESGANPGESVTVKYFSNWECEYFPCHKGADPKNFNCLFCYCPLYVLGDRCGGKFVYLPNGDKDCSRCLFPHLRENYGAITERYVEILTAIPYPDQEDNE
nr:cysteine-rich small domain-containing protein [[Clostridium] innocuum]